jgi:hypothetical protein
MRTFNVQVRFEIDAETEEDAEHLAEAMCENAASSNPATRYDGVGDVSLNKAATPQQVTPHPGTGHCPSGHAVGPEGQATIYLIDCEHDDEGGFILLLPVEPAVLSAMRQARGQTVQFARGLTANDKCRLTRVNFAVDLQGHYIQDDPEAVQAVLPSRDAVDLDNFMEEIEQQRLIPLLLQPRLDQAHGRAFIRTLSVNPDGRVGLIGTLDDEYVPGHGWHYGPRVDTVDFDMPEADFKPEEAGS